MHDKLIVYLKQKRLLWLICLLILLNCILLFLLFAPGQHLPQNTPEQPQQTIQQLYEITGGLGEMESVMEVLTLHGSVQYYADGKDWLYFEQMAGGFRLTLGKNTEEVSCQEFEKNGVHYTGIREKLGNELAWEDSSGYMFYLYSSLDMETLVSIAEHLALRAESGETA